MLDQPAVDGGFELGLVVGSHDVLRNGVIER
jgi:hypothetical protein